MTQKPGILGGFLWMGRREDLFEDGEERGERFALEDTV